MRQLQGNGAWGSKYACADCVADDYSESKADAKHTQQAACFVHIFGVPERVLERDSASSALESAYSSLILGLNCKNAMTARAQFGVSRTGNVS
jgi:hypothetical protein